VAWTTTCAAIGDQFELREHGPTSGSCSLGRELPAGEHRRIAARASVGQPSSHFRRLRLLDEPVLRLR